MPDLGNKFECYSCGAKFYDLGKPQPICPKCGANQKDAAAAAKAAHETTAHRRRRKEEPARVPDQDGEGPAFAETEGDDLAADEAPGHEAEEEDDDVEVEE
jgi:uncharacterized protein (TIGR02300 family)